MAAPRNAMDAATVRQQGNWWHDSGGNPRRNLADASIRRIPWSDSGSALDSRNQAARDVLADKNASGKREPNTTAIFAAAAGQLLQPDASLRRVIRAASARP